MLSANASGGNLRGTITLNGLPRRPAEYRKLCCYVMQRDVLLESATVRRRRGCLTPVYRASTVLAGFTGNEATSAWSI